MVSKHFIRAAYTLVLLGMVLMFAGLPVGVLLVAFGILGLLSF